jgi:hypothetical protein
VSIGFRTRLHLQRFEDAIGRRLFAAPIAHIPGAASPLVQTGILFFTVAALWLLGDTAGPWYRYGFLVGLAGQPLYLIATWQARQWGMFLAAFFVTGLWVRGVLNHF